MKNLPIDWRILAGAAVAAASAAGVAYYWWRKRRPDPQEIERQRRSHLNQVGRICEGQVIELIDAPPAEPRTSGSFGVFRKGGAVDGVARMRRKLVCYSYSISGVTYETAQDITGLEEHACLDRLAAGQPASVKYDPANPTDSILLADDWSGIH